MAGMGRDMRGAWARQVDVEEGQGPGQCEVRGILREAPGGIPLRSRLEGRPRRGVHEDVGRLSRLVQGSEAEERPWPREPDAVP